MIRLSPITYINCEVYHLIKAKVFEFVLIVIDTMLNLAAFKVDAFLGLFWDSCNEFLTGLNEIGNDVKCLSNKDLETNSLNLCD
jgi:hypothetical protein